MPTVILPPVTIESTGNSNCWNNVQNILTDDSTYGRVLNYADAGTLGLAMTFDTSLLPTDAVIKNANIYFRVQVRTTSATLTIKVGSNSNTFETSDEDKIEVSNYNKGIITATFENSVDYTYTYIYYTYLEVEYEVGSTEPDEPDEPTEKVPNTLVMAFKNNDVYVNTEASGYITTINYVYEDLDDSKSIYIDKNLNLHCKKIYYDYNSFLNGVTVEQRTDRIFATSISTTNVRNPSNMYAIDSSYGNLTLSSSESRTFTVNFTNSLPTGATITDIRFGIRGYKDEDDSYDLTLTANNIEMGSQFVYNTDSNVIVNLGTTSFPTTVTLKGQSYAYVYIDAIWLDIDYEIESSGGNTDSTILYLWDSGNITNSSTWNDSISSLPMYCLTRSDDNSVNFTKQDGLVNLTENYFLNSDNFTTSLSGDFTLEWYGYIPFSSTSNYASLISVSDGSAIVDIQFNLSSKAPFLWQENLNYSTIQDNEIYANAGYNHLVMVRSGDRISLYLNATLIHVNEYESFTVKEITNYEDSTTTTLEQRIKFIKVYNVAKTQTEIQTMYNNL